MHGTGSMLFLASGGMRGGAASQRVWKLAVRTNHPHLFYTPAAWENETGLQIDVANHPRRGLHLSLLCRNVPRYMRHSVLGGNSETIFGPEKAFFFKAGMGGRRLIQIVPHDPMPDDGMLQDSTPDASKKLKQYSQRTVEHSFIVDRERCWSTLSTNAVVT
jgi:hypothetical protein